MLTELLNINPFLLFFCGVSLLYVGSEALINNSKLLASKFNIPPIIIGVTIVALGTSLPEFVVSMNAAMKNQSELLIGNIVGSNISNIAFVLGVILLFLPFEFRKKISLLKFSPTSFNIIFLFLVTFLFSLFLSKFILDTVNGSILLILFFIYIFILFKYFNKKQNIFANSNNHYLFLYVILSAFLLSWGSDIFIVGALGIADLIGLNKLSVGLTIAAFGTSTPELFVSIKSAIKKEYDFVAGSIIGSNIINIVFVTSISCLINTINIDSILININLIILIILTLSIPLVFIFNRNLNRILGLIFICIYFIFLYINFLQ